MPTVPSPSTPYAPIVYAFTWPDLEDVNLRTLQFDTTFADGSVEGRLQWNATLGTLEIGMPGGAVTLQIGKEQLIRTKNTSGVDIPNGVVVYASGAVGDNLAIDLADNTDDNLAIPTLGLTTEAIGVNKFGFVTSFGLVHDVNTAGLPVGTRLYLGTGGALVTSPPAPPNRTVSIGMVTIEDAATGVIFVRTQVVPRLNELSDVYAPAPNNGDVLKWVAASNRWEAVAP